ncbi:replication associated protein [Lake Sarah-associated circular virus-4]|uniref:replication associated protein n=1 Tax=Lake Sarah-associated circular virus-4 TaxID=1685768 RepID=UPI000776BF0C|nr:replication associated protein [Lake Sarah-associated circular virus-4]ALE29585.1 replication associated protein [Lake Sarah-associated circular virus-4]ALE29587.1 replication associated protein [Lake Sarah-associated circular virus-4]ALE29589.1 replication associated protein [Lake Sarah-associated circular virus-4]ALE29591.1 replication associated protein [Lake Sarah-associated circular virus-4]ALE29593.1 replication associated protein [Lake Sarah-associated circular virus-4]
MTQRATCWSITINNPTDEETKVALPVGWKLTGQIEQGEEGTVHYQGMLTTTQQRFGSIKVYFPRAHIEVARNKKALSEYVHKSDTRVAKVDDNISNNIFQWQAEVAKLWNDTDFTHMKYIYDKEPSEDVALKYVDSLCGKLIREGAKGLEFVAVNPMWRSSWKRFYFSIITRDGRDEAVCETQVPQGEETNEKGS